MTKGTRADVNDAGAHADRLLAGLTRLPKPLFNDWQSQPDSFAAITAFWHDLFRTAAGAKADNYRDTGQVTMEEWGFAFDVETSDHSRRIRGNFCEDSSSFCIIWKDATDYYRPELTHQGERPNRAELSLNLDMQAASLIANFEIIRAFIAADIPSCEASEELEVQFNQTWGHVMMYDANAIC
jgi:hypothetical protein